MANSQKDKLAREKLVARGVQTLSDSELLSLIIEGKDCSCTLAEKLLEAYDNNLNSLSNESLKNLRQQQGLGIKNAANILAALELGRRVAQSQSEQTNTITSNQDIYSIFRPLLAHLTHEEFWVLYLNASNGILDKAKISQGGVTSMIVDHKLIIKRAVELLASGLVIVHNHPSGNPKPSEEDITLTRKLTLGASLFEINVLDHIIITPSENISFKQLGIF
ncbi:MAG: DNA repair protein RadC [Rikenellaceae bacterium]